ncbi:TSUP family transporter [Pseudomonas sp. BP8]|uniref:TSUP family transporter n=1 Tax=Pseudomonas sp. BP8 TaxID=2817864 RepID=UPI001AE98519|nr:TSUP family transporter [Pseudomonas sp. BP8]MBP2261629.1 putative membrane protein YfcA [Pseudomonas sp. BP8]HDS1733531.1 TSUP family transporter [Pseudomonas putida]
MELWQHLGFVLCVALATFAQNTTGFAFGLLLLGLTGMLGLAPMETVANVSSILTLTNALVMVRTWPGLQRGLVLLILGCSLAGVVGGVHLLALLGTHERDLLQLTLGVTIVICSLMLILQSQSRQRLSGRLSFAFFAGISGVMGGLFSSAGPPLVYQLYRQPLATQVIRDTLIVVFAANALMRLSVVVATDRFDLQAGYLALEALPVVFVLTWWMRRHPLAISPRVLRLSVFGLLLLAGGSLIGKVLIAG